MTEVVRNTLVVVGLFMVLIVRLAIDWIKYEMRK